MVERSAGVEPPDNWPQNEVLHLDTEVFSQNDLLRQAIDIAAGQSEPGCSLMQELSHFERVVAENALEMLESSPEGLAVLESMRARAFDKFQREKSKQSGLEP